MLKLFNEQYENILHSDVSERHKDIAFSNLMTEMEQAFKIPMKRNEAWEQKNRPVIALYRKISMSRKL